MGNNTSQNGDSSGQQSKEIFVQLLCNEVTHKYADVIIAFVDTKWNLDPKDEILLGLARIGGNMFISEWKKIREQNAGHCQVGDVFCVQPGGLPCRHVLFAVWRDAEISEPPGDYELNFVVQNMLERTQSLDGSNDHTFSVAIPMGCVMDVEIHVKILNNVFLWLMALTSQTVTHIHFLASNETVERTLEGALQNFKEFAQNNEELDSDAGERTNGVEVNQDLLPEANSETSIPSADISDEDDDEDENTTENNYLNRYNQNGDIELPLSAAKRRCDEYPNNFPQTHRLSSESNEDDLLNQFKKSVDKFPEKESIWNYYTGSMEIYHKIVERLRRSVKFDENAKEFDPETGKPVIRTLSQSSGDEVNLDFPNFERKRKKPKPKPKPIPEPDSEQTTKPPADTFFCSICQSDKDQSCKRMLSKCGHEFCTACIDKYFEENSPACPNCKTFYGKPLGNQPFGIMSYIIVNQYLPGYPGTDTIIIEYDIPDGIQTEKHPNPGKEFKGTHRTAYLPDNEHGQKIHRMLQRAFDQKLIFTIGKSRTTGRENVVTWNDIHHKTRPDGGPERYGYPDPEYLDRVEEQLRKAGITDELEDS